MYNILHLMNSPRFYIIGMSDHSDPTFLPEVQQCISKGRLFSGGRRHRELVSRLLPEHAEWIDVTLPLAEVFRKYQAHAEIVVFVSGDPWFFGLGSTLKREFPESQFIVYPYFNSLQMLAHRLQIAYHEMHTVSLTGRPWLKFDEAVISGEPLIGVLTDKHHTPSAIASRMRDYGYDNYRMYVGESLGNDSREHTGQYTLEEACKRDFPMPNCLILERTYLRPRPFGIPEQDFHLLNGRSRMITKMPVRLATLHLLDLRGRHSLWDIGFCTGSVSIEAKLQFPHLNITAFEQREEGEELMEKNSRKFGAPGITAVIGDFMQADLNRYPAPDAVFIGGHGGHLPEILDRIASYLLPGGVIVFNSVSEESLRIFQEHIARIGKKITACTLLAVEQFNPIQIIQAS